MENVGKLPDAENKVLDDTRALLAELSRAGSAEPQSAEEAVGVLSQLRDLIYENLNQIQHEYMILAAVRYLVKKKAALKRAEWKWNPRQTGGINEPDLQGVIDGAAVVSAEVTTSKRPIGTIADRLRNTLRKLSRPTFPGEKYYFVRSKSMEKCAQTIIQKEDYPIEVIRLDYAIDEL